TGGKVEILLLHRLPDGNWKYISRPGFKSGHKVIISPDFWANIIDSEILKLSSNDEKLITKYGHTPLPPYIPDSAPEKILRRRYQTVYARNKGSAAAPTAGLHFTPRLLSLLKNNGIELEFLTLHVGLGTFKPPTVQQIAEGRLHSEQFLLKKDTARRLSQAKSSGRRIIAVGTTTTRVLETLSSTSGNLSPDSGQTDIFIKSPYRFKFVDGLITNFHLPGSSLLMLVSAFASSDIISRAYQTAIKRNYRFYSFGDAMLII
ncbi:tRNA preQ1(34) S-adenosylmethionine ribosyltransferase-isomerase QueA, partial [Candidatus Amesbacteria bacterium RIFOXYB1_FULL_47_9]